MVPVKVCAAKCERDGSGGREGSRRTGVCAGSQTVCRDFYKIRRGRVCRDRKNKDILVAAANRGYFDESDVYSFLQGPKSWGEGRAWSGEWSNQYVRGNYFGNFGCGLCCMANIYSTFSGHTCSPWDMFLYAREVSGYTPTKRSVRSAGAI